MNLSELNRGVGWAGWRVGIERFLVLASLKPNPCSALPARAHTGTSRAPLPTKPLLCGACAHSFVQGAHPRQRLLSFRLAHAHLQVKKRASGPRAEHLAMHQGSNKACRLACTPVHPRCLSAAAIQAAWQQGQAAVEAAVSAAFPHAS